MSPHAATELILAGAAVAAVTRLAQLNLARRFPALIAYLVFLAVENLGYGLLNSASEFYFWTYIALEPLECVFGIVAVRELFALTFNEYPGIRTVGRWVMYAGVTLALGISLLLTGFFWSSRAMVRADAWLYYVEVSQRSIFFPLAFVIATILLFLSRYPLHLSRDTLVSSAFFSVIFLSETVGLLIDSLAPKLYNLHVDWAESVFMSICLAGWAFLLKPEPRTAPAQIRFSSPDEDHLLQQLDALNQLMTRAARR
jgi:hypothetical protein